jgi:hypothetical protein
MPLAVVGGSHLPGSPQGGGVTVRSQALRSPPQGLRDKGTERCATDGKGKEVAASIWENCHGNNKGTREGQRDTRDSQGEN